MSDSVSAVSKFFKDNEGKVVVWQTPNVPLIAWAVFMVLSHVLPKSTWQHGAVIVSFGFIFAWAWLEITKGASYFRRLLGLVVLLLSVSSRLG